MSVLWACVVAQQSDDPDSGGQDDRHEGAVASRLVPGARGRDGDAPVPRAWFRDSVRLAERLTPYAPNVEASWTDEVERWLGTMGDAGSK